MFVCLWVAWGISIVSIVGEKLICRFLGQNSKRLRLQRELVDVQTRMRLRSTGSKEAIRQSYLSALLTRLADPLLQHAQKGADEVIQCMDDYLLMPDDREALLELEVGEANCTYLDKLKKLPAPVKSAFTRAYNSRDHPIAFQRATNLPLSAQKTKAISTDAQPDNEDAYGVDEEVIPANEPMSEDEDTKDPLIKVSESKPKGKRKSKAK